MNEHDSGRLRAYLDGELSPEARQAVAAHVDRCARCADEVRLLGSRSSAVRAGLAALDAAPPDPKLALTRFRLRQAQAPQETSPSLKTLLRSIGEMKRNALSNRWRPAIVALSALLVVALLFTIAPVRGAAADFLGLFRVRKFAVIPLDQNQMERLEQLARQAEGALGEPQILREEGPEQPVGDAAQAAALAGYTVRTPSRLPDGATVSSFTVQSGPAMRIEFDRAAIAAVMQAAGASTAGLPETDKISADVDVANVVALKYQVGGSRLQLIQMPSPQVNVPQGIDPVALAEAGFMLLGMPQEDARRLATSIDWTSTLVVPMPANAGTAREVTVDGATGLLLDSAENGRSENAVLWEKDGILYFLTSSQLDRSILLNVADSLQ